MVFCDYDNTTLCFIKAGHVLIRVTVSIPRKTHAMQIRSQSVYFKMRTLHTESEKPESNTFLLLFAESLSATQAISKSLTRLQITSFYSNTRGSHS